LAREERERQEKRLEKERAVELRYRREKDLIPPMVESIEALLTNMQSCFDILVPDFRKGLDALDEGPGLAPPSTTLYTQAGRAALSSSGATNSAAGFDLSDEDDEDIEWEEADPLGGLEAEMTTPQGPRDGSGSEEGVDSNDDDFCHDFNAAPNSGFGSAQYQIHIKLPTTQDGLESNDTKPLFDTLREGYSLLCRKYRPIVQQYVKLLDRVQLSLPADRSTRQDLKTCTTRLLSKMEAVIEKCHELKVDKPCDGQRHQSKSSLGPDILDLQAVLQEGGT